MAEVEENRMDEEDRMTHLTVKEVAPGITGRILAQGLKVPEPHLC